MKKCRNCGNRILFSAVAVPEGDFCSSNCLEGFQKLKSGFCEKCRAQTTQRRLPVSLRRACMIALIAITVLQICSLNALAASNLTPQRVIVFGHFTAKITMCRFSTETPQNHEKVSAGHKYLLVSMTIVKLEKDQEVSSSKFVLHSAKAEYAKPGAWGKTILFNSLSNIEASSGASIVQASEGADVNLIFEVPESASLNEFVLQYR
jgi:hypothetical protein